MINELTGNLLRKVENNISCAFFLLMLRFLTHVYETSRTRHLNRGISVGAFNEPSLSLCSKSERCLELKRFVDNYYMSRNPFLRQRNVAFCDSNKG